MMYIQTSMPSRLSALESLSTLALVATSTAALKVNFRLIQELGFAHLVFGSLLLSSVIMTEEDVDHAACEALSEGIMGLLRPAVEEVDERVRTVRYDPEYPDIRLM